MSISPRSVDRAARVLHSGDQELIVKVQSGEMAVSAAAEKLAEKPAPPAPAATGAKSRFPILHAEPRSWELENIQLNIAPLHVYQYAANDAVLFLRAPDHALLDAVKLIEGWGFAYQATIVVKRRAHPGRYTQLQHDLVLIASRGRPAAPAVTPASIAAGRPGLNQIIDEMFPGLPRADALQVCGTRPK